MSALVAVGLLSLLAQVVVLRELYAAFFGIELIYVIALAVWLAGTAAGALGARAMGGLARFPFAAFGLAGVILVADIAVVRDLHRLFGGVPGAYLPFGRQMAAVALAVVPLSLIFGALFVWAADEWGRRGASLARSYAAECTGALVGGAWSTAALKLGQSNVDLAVTGGVLALAFALTGPRPRTRVWRAAAGAAIVLTGVAGFAASDGIDLALLRRSQPFALDTVDTPFSRVSISRRSGQVAVFSNGALVFESEGTSAELFAALAGIQHPHPGRALVLGGGPEGVVRELRKQVIDDVVHVELDRRGHAMVSRHLPTPESVPTRFGDPRALLSQIGDRFDLVVIAMGAPVSGEASRFYTREFFRLVRETLAPGGVVALRLPASENLWSVPMRQQNASVYRSVRATFPHVAVVPGTTLFLFGSDAVLPADGDAASARLAARDVEARLATPAYVRYLYDSDRRPEVVRLLDRSDAGETTDLRPGCYRHAMLLWLSKFYPRLAGTALWSGLADGAPGSWRLVALALAVMVMLALWMRRSSGRRLMALAFVAGFSGLVLESAVLLRYQITRGVVFEHAGILLGCFMAGMTLGAWALDRCPDHVPVRVARWLAVIVGVSAVVVAAVMWVPGGLGLAGAGTALATAGVLGGSMFGAASRLWRAHSSLAAPRLYGADLAGGAAGAILATIVLIPLGGLDVTAGVAVSTALVAIVALLPA